MEAVCREVFVSCAGGIFRLWCERGRKGIRDVIMEQVDKEADCQHVEEDSYISASSHSEHAFAVLVLALWLRKSVALLY